MTDSTSNSYPRPKISLTDALTASEKLCGTSQPVKRGMHESGGPRGAWDLHPVTHGMVVTDVQHAKNRALLRRLGRTERNETAEPEARQLSNEYNDHTSRLEARIKEFLSYTPNWDGDSAKEIPLEAVYASLNFLDEVKRRFSGKQPRSAAPSPDGEIALYWHSPFGYAEVNFHAAGNVSICWGDETNEMRLVEEKDENIVEHDKSRIWETLSEFLDQRY